MLAYVRVIKSARRFGTMWVNKHMHLLIVQKMIRFWRRIICCKLFRVDLPEWIALFFYSIHFNTAGRNVFITKTHKYSLARSFESCSEWPNVSASNNYYKHCIRQSLPTENRPSIHPSIYQCSVFYLFPLRSQTVPKAFLLCLPRHALFLSTTRSLSLSYLCSVIRWLFFLPKHAEITTTTEKPKCAESMCVYQDDSIRQKKKKKNWLPYIVCRLAAYECV